MKILFYIESLAAGGKERRLVELIKGLNNFGNIEIELVLIKKDIHYSDIFNTKIKIHFTSRKVFKKDPRLFYNFYKIVRKSKPDIIHVWGNMVAVYAILTKSVLNVPLINNQITDAPSKVSRGFLSHKLTFPFSDKIIANSRAGLRAYSAPQSKSMVIYNGFDFNRLNKLEDIEEFRIKYHIRTKYVIGMVATFSELKDYNTYIKSAILILSERRDVTFLCIGSGDYTYYEKSIPLEFRKSIIFFGKQKSVESFMNICDIGVLTSNGEGISNSLIEFSALSRPILATNNGGTPELIKDNENGFLIEPFSYKELFQKIKYLLDNKKKRLVMGKKAKEIIYNKFEITSMVKQYIKEYKDIFKS